MDDFKEHISDSESEQEDRKKKKGELHGDLVEELNFGKGSEIDTNKEKKKSRQEVFQEIIAKNKLYRIERQDLREDLYQMTNELD